MGWYGRYLVGESLSALGVVSRDVIDSLGLFLTLYRGIDMHIDAEMGVRDGGWRRK